MGSKLGRFFCWMGLLVGLLPAFLSAQGGYQEVYQVEQGRVRITQKMPVLFRTYPVYRGANLYRVYLLVEVQNDFLQFILKEGRFEADMELEAVITGRGNNFRESRIWRSTAIARRYEDTNRRDLFHLTVDSVDLKPGKYQILLKYSDRNARRRMNRKIRIALLPLKGSFQSPPLFLYPKTDSLNGNFPWVAHKPSALREYWDFNQDLWLFLVQGGSEATAPVPVTVRVVQENEQTVLQTQDTLQALAGQPRLQGVELPLAASRLDEGLYQLQVDYLNGQDTVQIRQALNIVWFTKPRSLWDFNTAFRATRYLMSEEEYKAFSRGGTDEKRERFKAFWKQRDPTPETPFNELMAEYYTRVDSANARFSQRRLPGWKTDPGRIFILYGPPDKVEDRSLDPIDFPYLRWFYHLEGKELVFTFRAVEGRREYRLEDVEEKPLQ